MQECIVSGCRQLGVQLPDGAAAKLQRYLDLLERWNRVFNLTAVPDPAEGVPRHILDSLAVLPHIRGKRILDVGSGAGLPGIPLAVALPECRVVLLDSSAKRARFLVQVRAELGLSAVAVEHTRVEHYQPGQRYDTVISRAFASTAEFVRAASGHCVPGGRIIVMKGRCQSRRPEELGDGQILQIHVPGLDAERHVHIIDFPTTE